MGQEDLQAQKQKVGHGSESLVAMQQLEVHLKSYEQKLRVAKEEAQLSETKLAAAKEVNEYQAYLSETKLAAAKEVNEYLEAALQSYKNKVKREEETIGTLQDLHFAKEAELDEVLPKVRVLKAELEVQKQKAEEAKEAERLMAVELDAAKQRMSTWRSTEEEDFQKTSEVPALQAALKLQALELQALRQKEETLLSCMQEKLAPQVCARCGWGMESRW